MKNVVRDDFENCLCDARTLIALLPTGLDDCQRAWEDSPNDPRHNYRLQLIRLRLQRILLDLGRLPTLAEFESAKII